MIYISPSILSADLLKLQEQVGRIAENGADFIHVDVMDGNFVPNTTFGPNMVEAMKRITTKVPLDVHLMISNADRYIEDYAKAGADILTVHQEACTHLHRTVQVIKQNKMKAGVVINPATPISVLADIIPEVDLVLIMTVNPGFGGQTFIEQGLVKIKQARELINRSGRDILLEVDGGVNEKTIDKVVKAGANMLVAGSAIFNAADPVAAMKKLKEMGNAAQK